MHSLGIVQWNSTRWDHSGNPGGVSGSGLVKLALAEEGFLKQKSRIQWLKLGDQNSNFLHKVGKTRNSRNSINSITLENGSRIEDPETIKQEVINHFCSVLGNNMQESATDAYHMGGLAWSSEHLDILNSRISHEIIKSAMFSIDDSKAHGLDGFSSIFFRRV